LSARSSMCTRPLGQRLGQRRVPRRHGRLCEPHLGRLLGRVAGRGRSLRRLDRALAGVAVILFCQGLLLLGLAYALVGIRAANTRLARLYSATTAANGPPRRPGRRYGLKSARLLP
jgi:hypothetical protein